MPIFVNGEKLENDILEQELEMLVNRYREESDQAELASKEEQIREDAKQNAIERLILIQEARQVVDAPSPDEVESQFSSLMDQHGGAERLEQELSGKADLKQQIKARIADGIRLEKYFDQICADVETPTHDECRQYYDRNRSMFEYPEMLRASHIVRSPENGTPPEQLIADMLNIREALLKGASFAELANSRSQCNDDGGDLGWFPRGQMVPEFEDVVFNMEPGDISDVFQTPFGFHIVKLFEKRPGGVRDFEEIRYEIENDLLEQKKNEKIGTVVDELRKSAKIDEAGDEQATNGEL